MTRYAFINADGIVVNVIAGELSPAQQAQFLRDYSVLFGAKAVIEVATEAPIWMGGTYTDGAFAPPPAPEPAPEIIEGTSEVLPEPQPELEA